VPVNYSIWGWIFNLPLTMILPRASIHLNLALVTPLPQTVHFMVMVILTLIGNPMLVYTGFPLRWVKVIVNVRGCVVLALSRQMCTKSHLSRTTSGFIQTASASGSLDMNSPQLSVASMSPGSRSMTRYATWSLSRGCCRKLIWISP